MKKFLSKYSLKFPKSLIYMLQASEYNSEEFFAWLRGVTDFRLVENRKSLVKTSKAIVLLCFAYFVFIFFLIISLNYLIFAESKFGLMLFALFILATPYITIFATVSFSSILNIIQKPIERSIVKNATDKLKKNKAVKIGIAGSFGKTTMKEILFAILSQSRRVRATPENKNTPLGISRFVDTLDGTEEIIIFEMGEYYKGDIKLLCELVDPSLGIITGVNEAHLEKFKHIENTTDTIFELADFLNKKDGSLYVNGENNIAKEKSKSLKNKKVIVYNKEKVGEFSIEDLKTDLSGVNFVIRDSSNQSIVARSSLLGKHQAGPISVAAIIAKELGVKLTDIELGIKNTKAFDHRMQLREDSGGVFVIDDSYNGNPDGVKVAIDFLKEIKDRRRFFVTPGLVEMGRKTEEVHKEIGALLAHAGIEKVVLIKNSVTGFIEKGLKENNFQGEIVWFNSGPEAFSNLPKRTVSNDLVLYQNDWPDNYR